ncbi:MAG: FkbM family methyltransferase [Blastochloris sp.]|nr:FkbM family methyltransferase [Blastochloris sp.]
MRETYEIWEDERSRELYLEALSLRCHHDNTALREPDRARQYFPMDLPGLPEPVRLIDGGAFVGDSIEAMVRAGVRIEAVAAFEPDAGNFVQLKDTVTRLELAPALLFPCGLLDRAGSARFQSGLGAASGSYGGEESIPMVSLDESLPEFGPTLIKLDIEGAEPAALAGARQMITAHSPRLAVCLYHTPEHLWELPRLMKELNPSYRLFLRYHGHNGFDLVAYAIPSSDF